MALSEELNFTRAAASVPMAQPAFSQAIERIERKLRVQLFIRTSRRVEPTEAGRMLAERARGILHGVHVAVGDTQLAGGGKRLRVHVTESSLVVVRRVLAAIRNRVAVPVHLTTVPRAQISQQLLDGGLDIVLGSKLRGPGVKSVRLADEAVTSRSAAHSALSSRPAS